jgi:catechol 2,3-dioxygenase-like lactoylglutathione lyase family enzyme
MAEGIEVQRVMHVIHSVWDYNACRVKYMDTFGALVFAEGYNEVADRDMNLFYVGDFMIEPMAPRDKPVIYRQYLEKYGEGWHSLEFRVDDMEMTLATLRERGVRYSDYVPFTHPKDSFGVMIELVAGPMPNDPFEYPGWEPNWYDGNPLSLERLAAIVIGVKNLAGARDFLVELWGAEVVTEDSVKEPEALDRCHLQVAGTPLLLVSPTGGSGPITHHMGRRNEGIYSMAWKVGSLDQAAARLAKLGLGTEAGASVLGGISINPDHLFGARHELVEQL